MFDKSIFALHGIKRVTGLLVGLAFLQAIFIVGQAWTLSAAIANLWAGGKIVGQVPLIVGFLLFFLGRQLAVYFRDRYLEAFTRRQAGELRRELLLKIFRSGPRLVQKNGTANVTAMALEGIDQIQEYLRLVLSKLIGMLVIPTALLVYVFFLEPVSGWVLLVVTPLIVLFMVIFGHAARSKASGQYKSFQLMSNHFIDSLRGIDTLKLFGISKQYSESIFHTSEKFRRATMETLRVANLSGFSLDFFSTLAVAIVAVFLGLRLMDGTILLFPALMALVLSPEYFLPIRNFAADYHATLEGKNAMHAVQTVLSEEEKRPAPQALPWWDDDTTIAVQGVSYAYPDYTALRDISFAVRGFRKIGIIGMSGAGKTTLVNLLGGFALPDQGTIQVGKCVLPGLMQPDWQKQLLYIPQNPYIFHATLRENIAFYNTEATQDAILKAIDVVGLRALVQELPDGLATLLGEGARALSGGQAQRIALARAFLDDRRKILLFDEPTAHLDIETEVELKEKMLPLMENRLVFFATHRLHWMREMDYILVMEQGKIVQSGTLDELASKDGAFTRLSRQIGEDEV